MVSYYKFGETMIKVGDLVRVKWSDLEKASGVFLVLEISENSRSRLALCAQGSRKEWLYMNHMEKL